MPKQVASPFKEIARRMRGVLFRNEDELLKELLPKTGDEELVHIIDSVSVPDKLRLFRGLGPVRQGKVLNELSEYSSDSVLAVLSKDEVRRLIDSAESDFAVDIIQWLAEPMRIRIISDLKKSDPHGLLPLLVFDEETAGGRMKTEILKYQETMTVGDVRKALAKDTRARSKTNYLYIVRKDDTLLGYISPIKLLQVDSGAFLKDIVSTDIEAVPATMDQQDVALAFDEQDAIELPVVNLRNRLLGVITADDIFEVLEEEYAEDVSRLAGVSEDAHITDPILLSARRRIPWLGVNLITATIAASVVSFYSDTISRVVILAAFMPIVAGIGGNAAQQALAITIRAISLGDLHQMNTMRAIAKEVLIGGLNGFLTGSVMGVLAYLWTGNAMIGVVILLAMTLNLLAAGLAAVTVPLTMKALKTDPALASTVFVTATTDIFGFFVFLGLATLML